MSLYPSLEDMNMDHLCRAQVSRIEAEGMHATRVPVFQPDFNNSPMPVPGNARYGGIYPALEDFMGLDLSVAVIAENMPEYTQMALQQVGICLDFRLSIVSSKFSHVRFTT